MKYVTYALFASISMVTIHAQSLADVAKKTEEERAATATEKNSGKAATKPTTKVYTNKDLKDAPAPASVESSSSAPIAATAEPSETERSAEYRKVAKKDEAYWKGRLRDLLATQDADTIHLAAMGSRVASLTADFDNSDSISQRAVIRGEREVAATEVTRLKAAVLTDKHAIATLEEEARRANVPAGWLRQ
jgi:hypothetical protein